MLRRLGLLVPLVIAMTIVPLAVGAILDGQGTECLAYASPGIVVDVRDAKTGEQAGDGATVTIEEGKFRESRRLSWHRTVRGTGAHVPGRPNTDEERWMAIERSLGFSGAVEREGTYKVTVSKPGYVDWTDTVTVESDECHVITEVVHARLTPSRNRPDYEGASKRVLDFLRGRGSLENVELADQVHLVAPISRWSSRKIAGSAPHERTEWYVLWRGHRYPFTPPNGDARLTTTEGTHLLCSMPRTLASIGMWRYVTAPHVGTTLHFGDDSCLQTWNLTFVFDASIAEPTLVAVVYDQWEW